MTDKPKIFVSFPRRDAAFAVEWVMVLRERGIRAFCSYEDIKPGDDWHEKLREAIADCDELLLLCSPEAVQSEWVLIEIGAAWALGKRITPILLAGEVEELPDHLRRIQFAKIDSVEDLERLIEQICTRHGQEGFRSPVLPFTFQLGEHDLCAPLLNDSPPCTITPYQPNWVRCPFCKKAFSIQNKYSWDGTCHLTCGQRLIIAEVE